MILFGDSTVEFLQPNKSYRKILSFDRQTIMSKDIQEVSFLSRGLLTRSVSLKKEMT